MRLKSTVFFLALLFSTVSVAGLQELVELKSNNYIVLSHHYESLLTGIKQNEDKLFCKIIQESQPVLEQIFYDDVNLVKELRQTPDYREYATHIEDNSFSPLFSHASHEETCANGDFEQRSSIIQSLEYHVMNINYLNLTHEMWREAYGPFKN